MLFPVAISADANGRLQAMAPDLPGCEASGSELGRTLTRIHLKLEGRVSELLLAGEQLPATSCISAVRQRPEFSASSCYEIHINETHLAAVAKHQRGK